MKDKQLPENPNSPSSKHNLEEIMQRVSRIVSLLALGLMVVGFASMVSGGVPIAPPGVSALTLPRLASFATRPFSMISMSAGIILLAILPGIRVGLALYEYLRQRNFLNSLIALIILVELLISVRAGR